jgi:hypothetical protein
MDRWMVMRMTTEYACYSMLEDCEFMIGTPYILIGHRRSSEKNLILLLHSYAELTRRLSYSSSPCSPSTTSLLSRDKDPLKASTQDPDLTPTLETPDPFSMLSAPCYPIPPSATEECEVAPPTSPMPKTTRLVLVGDGPARQSLERLSIELGINAIFEGRIADPKELAKHYASADLFAYVSLCFSLRHQD